MDRVVFENRYCNIQAYQYLSDLSLSSYPERFTVCCFQCHAQGQPSRTRLVSEHSADTPHNLFTVLRWTSPRRHTQTAVEAEGDAQQRSLTNVCRKMFMQCLLRGPSCMSDEKNFNMCARLLRLCWRPLLTLGERCPLCECVRWLYSHLHANFLFKPLFVCVRPSPPCSLAELFWLRAAECNACVSPQVAEGHGVSLGPDALRAH